MDAVDQIVEGGVAELVAQAGVDSDLEAIFLLDLIHLALIEWDIRVSQTPDPLSVQRTHYGPPGHPSTTGEPGKELRFTIRVTMSRDVSRFVVNCGELAGFQSGRRGS